jgi:hypothetical protein
MLTTLIAPAVDPEALIAELAEHAGLSEVDAITGAFTAIAYGRGWTQARIARCLGVSRARVAQRVEIMRGYIDGYYIEVAEEVGGSKVHFIEPRTMPVLRTALESRPEKVALTPDMPICFTPEDWKNRKFTTGLIDQLLER